MYEAPFIYPSNAGHRLLGSLGTLEHLLRAALRRIRGGQDLFSREDLGRLRSHRPGRQPLDAPGGRAADHEPILFFPAVPWDYRFQRPQQMALALADHGHPVLYFDSFDRDLFQARRTLEHRGGQVFTLKARIAGRPDPYRGLLTRQAADRLAELVTRGLRRQPLAVVVQLPFWGELGQRLRERLGVPLVYDRIDLHTDFPGAPQEVGQREQSLLRSADLLTVSSTSLGYDRGSEIPGALVIPNGVSLEDFRRPVRRIRSRPQIGYVGALGAWFDAAALRQAATAHPEWDFRLAGRVEDDGVAQLAELPNLLLLGEIPYSEVPLFLADLDVALIPFLDTPLTRAVDPVKLYEALAAGLPIVARRLPEVARWQEPAVYLYDSAVSLGDLIGQALREDTQELALDRRRLVKEMTWTQRSQQLLDGISSLSGKLLSRAAGALGNAT